MTDPEVLDNAPKGAGVFDITGEYFDEYNNHLNKQGFWSQKDTSPVSPRSLEDIRRIVELEKDRDIRDLEQQAMGLADYVSKVMDSSYILHLDPKNTNHCILINLNAAALRLLDRAQALKEQVKP